ncbi:MAG: formate dehydrogenase accessory sulfurtransferase FdhD [Methylophilaceae bacterium]|nr:formate dehydrogenase accessory sulfurtransferase FdhD [Methylophilaceae bacterium]
MIVDSHCQSFGSYSVTRSSGKVENDAIAEEVPVALVYNGISHAVMLATPQDLADFALGFSLSEGIIKVPSEMYDIDIVTEASGISLQINIPTERFSGLKQVRRILAGRTGCGLCGTDSLEHAIKTLEPLNKINFCIQHDALLSAYRSMPSHQALQIVTGATHASAWVSLQGEILLVREDVGRHNALDKLIGSLAKSSIDITSGFILTTSRASYEMVQKTVSAGVQLLAAVSAPTGLAIRMADKSGLALVGFLRDKSYVIYSHVMKIKPHI